ncbi:MAG: aminotransferase class I/II-fold pyridoxal phosphate-dependent enzyme [Gemmatimonadota bacterium]|nr:MAG: aminotransferase class I/II-fold pyridoxal phosphate-dependent enzyme [Gemmatimonadota bacterium]
MSETQETTLEMPSEEMRRFGHDVVESIVRHFETLRDRPVVSWSNRDELEALLREPPPEDGMELGELLGEFEEKVVPHMSHVDHPRMFGFIPGAGTFVGAMGDALASGHNIYAGTWIESSAAHQVELVVVDWFRQWLGMPESAGGTLVSGGSVANLTGLVLAREVRLGDMREDGVIYTSELAHSSVDRGARILGFRPDQVRKIPTDEACRMDVDALWEALLEDAEARRWPFCVVANAGDTSTGSVDPLSDVADFCAAQGLWLHVDAAYGGFAVLDPRGRELLRGIERADSVALDPHKWLYTPFEAGCVLVRDFRRLYEVFHILPDYLVDVAGGPQNVNMCDHGIALSRSSRALKIWLAIKHFGLGRYRAVISRTMGLARYAQELLEATPGIEVVSPAVLSVVTFRYVPSWESDEEEIEQVNHEIRQRVWESGAAMITSSRVRGRYVLRLCVVNHNTRRADVEEVVRLIGELGPAVRER